MTAAELRHELADGLVARDVVRSAWLRQAFEETPREVFVPRFYRSGHGGDVLVDGADPARRDEWLRGVYADDVLVVQHTQALEVGGDGLPTSSSSMPTVMAGMLEALDVQPGHRVLEIGTGTGYNAALLCHRVGADNVSSVELDPALADAARQALERLGLYPAVRAGDGATGFAERAPFDRIIATTSATHIPPAWIEQLAPGGVVLLDLRGGIEGGLLRLSTVDDGEVQGRFLGLAGSFMPMRPTVDSPHRDGERWDLVLDVRNPQRGSTLLDPALLDNNDSLRLLAQLHLAGQHARISGRSGEAEDLTGRATDGSWFEVGATPDDDGRYPVRQGGSRRLWDCIESGYTAWQRHGRPGIERFGVTAVDDAELQFVWLDDADSGPRWPLPL